MAEIIKIDQIGTSAIENITGITKINENTVFVSGKNSSKNTASYELDKCGKLFNGPNYSLKLPNIDIRSISSYKNFLVVVPYDQFKIYIISDSGLGVTYDLKITNPISKICDEIVNYVANPILEILPSCSRSCLTLMQTIIVDGSIYFFVQTNCSHMKGYILFVLEGLINEKLELSPKIKLQTFFNLYRNGRVAKLSKTDAKSVTFGGACKCDSENMFMILLIYGSCGLHGYLTKIEKYAQFNGMSSKLEIINENKLHVHPKPLIINKSPRSITSIGHNNYIIVTNHKKNELTTYYIVKN
jgi:hypothetical protein